MHLHGYNFAVMGMGFPDYNTTSGLILRTNKDIICETGYFCPDVKWRDKANPPSLNTENPPIKDTVIIPGSGYVVIRFKSVNPGFWLFHCHSETHLMEGMSMIFNVGPGHHPPLPQRFPRCGDFDWDSKVGSAGFHLQNSILSFIPRIGCFVHATCGSRLFTVLCGTRPRDR